MAQLDIRDFQELEAALTSLRTANSQSNAKSAQLKTWFEQRTGKAVAVSNINEAKQIGNRLKEQRGKLAPYTLFFCASTDISDRTLKRLSQYVYPNLEAVFFFVHIGGKYLLRTLARGKGANDFVDQIAKHYAQIAPITNVPLPDPEVVTWGSASGGGDGAGNLAADDEELEASDQILQGVKDAMADGYAGVILVGPPGTGKSRYARLIASSLVSGDPERLRFVQFHPSYQYEDFVRGYVPDEHSFKPEWKVFGALCEIASNDIESQYVLIIDEISRSDTARVFGEALTYIEMDKRGHTFTLASGTEMEVPSNIFIIATMNPWDRGVDDMDVALERRFAEIDVLPTADGLSSVLAKSSLSNPIKEGVAKFFAAVQALDNPYCHIGHAYFLHAKDSESLLRLWRFRLHPFFRRACRGDKSQIQKIENMWRQLVAEVVNPPPASANEQPAPAE